MKPLLLFWLILSSFSVTAQTTTVHNVKWAKGQRLLLDLQFPQKINIVAWDKNEVSVSYTQTYSEGYDTSMHVFDIQQSASQVTIHSDFKKDAFKDKKNKRMGGCNGCNGFQNGSDCFCYTLEFEIKVPRGAEVTVRTISGDVEIVGLENAMDVESISGFVDVSWPSGKGVQVSLKSITGSLYSDLDLTGLSKPQRDSPVGYEVTGHYKEGGPTIRINTISSDIFVRKK